MASNIEYVLSSEPKPTQGLYKGKTIMEIDTGIIWIYDGKSTWYQQ